ncbi:MAG: DUF362 domain-containing protein [Cyanobacteria bacterium]|nr:DUF362 domain-containing protein [Cyanobacteria bacterium CG_2015-16_32_12]NCO77110.1 DUF362 domain-containing protein [Cyanobacteria bacterium CG_2015-22_32_23]NCQ03947.1 DUF362 domain-containing protein [Cyanobacteria bacterium CG_2015-09_32_10]NCQ42445.1 DUF362 domain-containing protein [Cyanobacteria bacterium CG_2015-04_32_10]NCS85977.1 DUF362 domain-containing protein [Cyanobacteria bacterium CG_2015-02_32_10]
MTQVSFIKAQSYELKDLRTSIENLLLPFGGISAFVKKGDRVLLKPNLLTASRPTKECTTRKEIVYCIAQMVQEVGGKPFLGDSPAFGSAKGVAKANGYLPLCEALNLPIIEFNAQKYPIDNDNFNHLRLSKEAMEADVIINLPKIKSHMQLTMTMGVKNLFGCVPGKMKAWWHMEAGKDASRFGEMLVETAKAIKPDLTIIDGIIAHEGNGPSAGEPRELGILGASSNVFALDVAIADILNVSSEIVPTLVAQKKLGLCSELKEIEFPLLKPEDLRVENWKLPSALMPIDFGLPRVLKSTFKHLYIKLIKEKIKSE